MMVRWMMAACEPDPGIRSHRARVARIMSQSAFSRVPSAFFSPFSHDKISSAIRTNLRAIGRSHAWNSIISDVERNGERQRERDDAFFDAGCDELLLLRLWGLATVESRNRYLLFQACGSFLSEIMGPASHYKYYETIMIIKS